MSTTSGSRRNRCSTERRQNANTSPVPKSPSHDRHQTGRPDPEHRGRAAAHLLLPSARLHQGARRARTSSKQSPAAKDAIAQILTNSRMCAEGHRPICQDTGIVMVFLKVGMDVRWDGATMGVTDMVNEGVRRAYLQPGQRAARVDRARPAFAPQEHEGQHAGGDPRRARAGRHGRREGRGERRRLGEQVEVRDAQPVATRSSTGC